MLLPIQRSEWLPPYDDEGLRVMLSEVDDISARLKNIVESYKDGNYPNPVKVSITYFHQCLNRNHRYIDRYVSPRALMLHNTMLMLSVVVTYSYLVNRLGKIRHLRWETGPVIPDSIRQDTLSTREKEYFMLYNDLLTEYNAMTGIDLTADLEVRGMKPQTWRHRFAIRHELNLAYLPVLCGAAAEGPVHPGAGDQGRGEDHDR